MGVNVTTVVIDNLASQISAYYLNGASGCDNDGYANFILPSGMNEWAASDGTYTWSSTTEIIANECRSIQLQ